MQRTFSPFTMADETQDLEEENNSFNRLVEFTRVDSAEDLLCAWKELREIAGSGKNLSFPIRYKSKKTSTEWLKLTRTRGTKEFKIPHSLLRFTRFEGNIVTIIDMATPMHGTVAAFFQVKVGQFIGAANDGTLLSVGDAKNGTHDVPDSSWGPFVRTYANPNPNGPPLPTSVPSVVLQVGWSESYASLESSADGYLAMQPAVRAVILVKLVKGSRRDRNRARVRANGDVAMRMRCKIVTAANPNPLWIDFGSDIVNNAPRLVAPAAGVAGPTLDLNTTDLYDGAAVPAGLPALLQFPLFSLQQQVHGAYLKYLKDQQ